MKLVSAAKLRRAQETALSGREYRDQLNQLLRTVMAELPPDFAHPLIEKRAEIKRRRVIVIAGERGLCGAYNANIFKSVLANEGAGIAAETTQICPIGKQATNTAKRFGWLTAPFSKPLAEDATTWAAKDLAEELLKAYAEREFDELVVYYTKFVSAMTQVSSREVLLPFGADVAEMEVAAVSEAGPRTTRFDPEPEEILVKLLSVLLGAQVRQAALEAKASEHAARMTAMDSATRNADDLISKLRLFYNRARQSAITRELIDIVGGAEAIK
jgi:F-type H+-transporting ATPase subunit gamma